MKLTKTIIAVCSTAVLVHSCTSDPLNIGAMGDAGALGDLKEDHLTFDVGNRCSAPDTIPERVCINNHQYREKLVICHSSTPPQSCDPNDWLCDGKESVITCPEETVCDTIGDGALCVYQLAIIVEGDLTPVKINDDTVGQTPSVYKLGLARFDLLRSENDPTPVTVFNYGAKPVIVDMLSGVGKGTKVATVKISDLPEGVFTHARVVLTATWLTVKADLHVNSLGDLLNTDISAVIALGDTTIDGKPWKQYQATYSALGYSGVFPGTVLPKFPTTPGGHAYEENNQTWLKFNLVKPLTINHTTELSEPLQAIITYKVYDSFRWIDRSDKTNYTSGKFDISAEQDQTGFTNVEFEWVYRFGATDYSISINQP